MSELKPVAREYDPGYPRSLAEEEIEAMLRPSLFRRFAKKTMLAAGTIVAGISISGCLTGNAQQPPGDNSLPKKGLSTRTDAKFEKKVHRLAAEILGKKVGGWNARSKIRFQQDLRSNPPIKYPYIPISFGNSFVGIMDTAKAKAATLKMFEKWGIMLEKNIPIKGPGYEFVADGYNKQLNIGFEIVMPEGRVGFGRQKLPPQPAQAKLDKNEMTAMDKDIKAGKRRLFVVQGGQFPNMDGDLYTPLEYYLASVIDYLNWVHGDRQMLPNSVLGRKRDVYRPPQRK